MATFGKVSYDFKKSIGGFGKLATFSHLATTTYLDPSQYLYKKQQQKR